MLDADLAQLYGVTTKRLNEQVKRNRKRFPYCSTLEIDNPNPVGLDYSQVEGPSVRKVHHYDRGFSGWLRHRDKTTRPLVLFCFSGLGEYEICSYAYLPASGVMKSPSTSIWTTSGSKSI